MMEDWFFKRRLEDPDMLLLYQDAPGISIHESALDDMLMASGPDISLIFPDWKGKEEVVLFVAPHDDDNHLGAGLLVQAVQEYGGDVRFLVVTDGRGGYYTLEEKANIYETRVEENINASTILGVSEDQIRRLDFPDQNLAPHFCDEYDRPKIIEPFLWLAGKILPDYTYRKEGMIKQFTRALRDYGVTRVVVPTIKDAHPDHKYTNEAMRMAIYHAAGEIWEECGEPISVPTMVESLIYCPFAEDLPDLRVIAPEEAFQRKMDSIAEFRSQGQIEDIIERVRQQGSVEFYRSISPTIQDVQLEDYHAAFDNKGE